MWYPGTHLGLAVAGSDLIELREGDPAAPSIAGDNPRVVRQVTTFGHRRKPARR
jgi:predicted heme/steroid binding protein